jgi:hypothetical protein
MAHTKFELLEDPVSALAVVAENAEAVNALPMEPIGYGVVAFCILFASLVVTYAFRSVGTRH